ncbi:unnamed protein product [Dovyalis caffra]|uniref:Uncharacterized protein n=1 Tax=Dovyalis caffra TaxID=77055 RepID=A0AAV1R8X9_9ROSI|nr:unnamed protein product [Dovyalis caffra]
MEEKDLICDMNTENKRLQDGMMVRNRNGFTFKFYNREDHESDMLTRPQVQQNRRNNHIVTYADVDFSLVDSLVGRQVVYGIGKDLARGKMSFNLTSVAMVQCKVELSVVGESGNLIGGAKIEVIARIKTATYGTDDDELGAGK